MILFLYGQDIYRSREELRRIVEEYKKARLDSARQANPDWLDFNRIDCRDKEIEIFEQIRQMTDTISMFNEGKLIIIENIFSINQGIQEEVLEFLKKRDLGKDKSITIIFWAEELDKRSKLFKFLKSKTKSEEFEFLKGNQLKKWIKDYISQQRGKIEAQAIEKLIEYIGKDLWRMTNEINKLINYSKTIKAENVELLVKPEIDLNIFEMVDALGYKNKNKVLNLFKQYLEKGEDENYLLSMFIYQIRNLIKAKAGGKLDMHPFVILKSKQQAKNFNWDDLKKIYHQLMTIDFEIKTGKTDPKTALEMFVVGL